MAEEKSTKPEGKKKMSTGLMVTIGCGGCLGLVILIIVISVIVGKGSKSNSTTPNSTQSSTTSTPTAKPTTKKFNIDEIYSQINTGMSEAEVQQIITKEPINCTESESQGIGTMKLCSYGNVFLDSGSIMVTYMNGKVYSKTKSQY